MVGELNASVVRRLIKGLTGLLRAHLSTQGVKMGGELNASVVRRLNKGLTGLLRAHSSTQG
eukprot:4069425-Pyramimonas_sp.AAC.1